MTQSTLHSEASTSRATITPQCSVVRWPSTSVPSHPPAMDQSSTTELCLTACLPVVMKTHVPMETLHFWPSSSELMLVCVYGAAVRDENIIVCYAMHDRVLF